MTVRLSSSEKRAEYARRMKGRVWTPVNTVGIKPYSIVRVDGTCDPIRVTGYRVSQIRVSAFDLVAPDGVTVGRFVRLADAKAKAMELLIESRESNG